MVYKKRIVASGLCSQIGSALHGLLSCHTLHTCVDKCLSVTSDVRRSSVLSREFDSSIYSSTIIFCCTGTTGPARTGGERAQSKIGRGETQKKSGRERPKRKIL